MRSLKHLAGFQFCHWSPVQTGRKQLFKVQLCTHCTHFVQYESRAGSSDFRLPTSVAMKGGDRPTRLLPYAKMLLVPKTFFPLLLGRLCSRRFWLCRLFHNERSWHTYRFTVVFVSGRQDLPSDARAYSLKLFITAE